VNWTHTYLSRIAAGLVHTHHRFHAPGRACE